jgi:hypothetical protein
VFSQIDIILIELAGELFITFMVTRMYLETSAPSLPTESPPEQPLEMEMNGQVH